MNVDHFYSILVYRFKHNVSHPAGETICRELEHGWQYWLKRMDEKKLLHTLDDTFFFLPYVRDMLYPEITLHHTGSSDEIIEDVTTWLQKPLHEQWSRRENVVTHLALKPEWMRILTPFQLEFPEREFLATVEVEWADVVLFPQNVGFLCLKIKLEGKPELSQVGRLLHYLHRVHPPKPDYPQPRWRLPNDGKPLALDAYQVVNFLLQGLTEYTPLTAGHLLSLEELRATGGLDARQIYTHTSFGLTYGEIFHHFSYVLLDEPAPNDVIREPGPDSRPDPFDSPFDRVLYELATDSNTGLPDRAPDPHRVQEVFSDRAIRLWENWQALVLKDNVTFLGRYPTTFTRNALPENIENDYFPTYLLALYQDTRLSLMFGELMMDREHDISSNVEQARQIMRNFVLFQNHYWFPEITRGGQGAEIYQTYQRSLGVQALYDQLNDKVRLLQDFYEARQQRQTNRALNFLSFVGIPLSVIAQIYGFLFQPGGTWLHLATSLVVASLIVLVVWLMSKRE